MVPGMRSEKRISPMAYFLYRRGLGAPSFIFSYYLFPHYITMVLTLLTHHVTDNRTNNDERIQRANLSNQTRIQIA